VLYPAELRTQVRETARRLAELHADTMPATVREPDAGRSRQRNE
jgi:hypothetical protein